jgi:predicted nucleic acid-binding protein
VRGAVVDASVALKWFVPEVHSEAATRLLDEGWDLQAPDLIRAELGNILWKKWRRQELSAEDGAQILADFTYFPLEIVPAKGLTAAAWEIARAYERSFYDSLYLALAQTSGTIFVTADQKLCRALEATPLKRHLAWIEDLPSPE